MWIFGLAYLMVAVMFFAYVWQDVLIEADRPVDRIVGLFCLFAVCMVWPAVLVAAIAKSARG